MVDPAPVPAQPTHWVDGESGVSAETAERHMKFVRVLPSELEDLKSSNSTLELAFFGISTGAFVTLYATIKTVPVPDPSTHATFVSLTFIAGFVALMTLAMTLRAEWRWRQKINGLKKGNSER